MKKLLLFTLIATSFLFVGCNGNNDTNEEVVAVAEDFLALFVEEKYDEAVQYFDETMLEQLPVEGLEETGSTLNQQLGKFIDSEYRETREVDGYDVVIIHGTYEVTDVMFSITVNDEHS